MVIFVVLFYRQPPSAAKKFVDTHWPETGGCVVACLHIPGFPKFNLFCVRLICLSIKCIFDLKFKINFLFENVSIEHNSSMEWNQIKTALNGIIKHCKIKSKQESAVFQRSASQMFVS